MSSAALVDNLSRQADLFCEYLIGRPVSDTAAQQYAAFVGQTATPLPVREQKLLGFALRHPFAIGWIDAGAALIRPQAEIRRRLYCMFAILEAQPQYSHKFLSEKHRPVYALAVGLAGLRAVFRAILGILLIKGLRA